MIKIYRKWKDWKTRKRLEKVCFEFWQDVDRINADPVLSEHSPLSLEGKSEAEFQATAGPILEARIRKALGVKDEIK